MQHGFRLGHVLSVFESKYSNPPNSSADIQGINFIDIDDTENNTKGRKKAIPLLRGYSDSVSRGDLILYINLNKSGKYYYLGPINTMNSPSYPIDTFYKPTPRYEQVNDRSDGYN